MTERIITYHSSLRGDVERFREQTFAEDNNSLSKEKFDPDTLKGQIWLAYEDDVLVSLSAAEESHYTDEPNVIRKCRYHILKKYRHGRYGFKFLQRMIPWCKENNYKLLYWTHDVTNVALNALYQKKRTYAATSDNSWFNEWPYTELHFEKYLLFKTGNMLQFVYSIYVDPSFVWNPKGTHMYRYPHCGKVVTWDEIKTVAVTTNS
jgi:GNAT superfamily N-acetyltransferase